MGFLLDRLSASGHSNPMIMDRIIAELKFLAGLFAFILVFFTLIWGHYKIPSESMQPTLEVGDHLYVSKFSYGYSRYSLPFYLDRLPFLERGRIFAKMPKRGDVAVFKNPNDGLVMIKRVVGLPGDNIAVTGGRLVINGQMINRAARANYLYREHKGRVVGVDVYNEQLPDEDTAHVIYEQTDQGPLDNVGPFTVPEGHVFFMGDNRDNSVDSRAGPKGPGMVPLDHLIGRADRMMFSFKRCNADENLHCPGSRWMLKL
jgi:signal peptidase I